MGVGCTLKRIVCVFVIVVLVCRLQSYDFLSAHANFLSDNCRFRSADLRQQYCRRRSAVLLTKVGSIADVGQQMENGGLSLVDKPPSSKILSEFRIKTLEF